MRLQTSSFNVTIVGKRERRHLSNVQIIILYVCIYYTHNITMPNTYYICRNVSDGTYLIAAWQSNITIVINAFQCYIPIIRDHDRDKRASMCDDGRSFRKYMTLSYFYVEDTFESSRHIYMCASYGHVSKYQILPKLFNTFQNKKVKM